MLAAGWVVDESGALRRETIHHMGRRLPGWDYRRRGYYVITIVLENRRSAALGELRIRRPAACAAGVEQTEWVLVGEAKGLKLEPDQVEAKVVYSELGRAIFDHFRKIGEFTPGLEPVYCAVMPDHLHLLLKVERELKRPLGNAIGGFKTGCEKIYAKFGGEGRLFAEGFVDHVILRGGQLAIEFNYLRDNPRRLAVKRLFPELFRVSRRVGVTLRGLGNQQLALLEHDRHEAPQGQDRQGAGVSGAPAARAVGYFSALGNHFLLDRPLAQVQVSRRFFAYRRLSGRIARDEKGEPFVEFSSPAYEARRDELFAAARQGVVLISPCISDGERQIAREALAAGVPLVTMANKGFALLQKPSGRLFDACSDGRLLMLAPAAWPYQPGEKPMTRSDAIAMNRLCQWLAGEGAAEINYRGLLPANIDALARDAAQVCYNSQRS